MRPHVDDGKADLQVTVQEQAAARTGGTQPGVVILGDPLHLGVARDVVRGGRPQVGEALGRRRLPTRAGREQTPVEHVGPRAEVTRPVHAVEGAVQCVALEPFIPRRVRAHGGRPRKRGAGLVEQLRHRRVRVRRVCAARRRRRPAGDDARQGLCPHEAVVHEQPGRDRERAARQHRAFVGRRGHRRHGTLGAELHAVEPLGGGEVEELGRTGRGRRAVTDVLVG